MPPRPRRQGDPNPNPNPNTNPIPNPNPAPNPHPDQAGGDGAAVVRLPTVGPALGPKLCILHAHPDDSEVAPGEEGVLTLSLTL